MLKKLCVVLCSLCIVSCQSVFNAGSKIDDKVVKNIQTQGYVNKQNVISEIGYPSLKLNGDKKWVYVSRKMSETSLTRPVVVEQKLITLYFDDKDQLLDITNEDGHYYNFPFDRDIDESADGRFDVALRYFSRFLVGRKHKITRR